MIFKFLILILSLITLSVLTLSQLGTALNLKALDVFQRSHPGHPDIVILAIDSKAIQKLGRWPWSRAIHAEIIDKLKEFSPSALGIDVIFSEPENEIADTALANSLASAKFPVVLAASAIFFQNSPDPQKILLPTSAIRKSLITDFGHTNLFPSEDGLTRSFPKNIYAHKPLDPFSFTIAYRLHSKYIEGDSLLVNFAGGAGSFPTYSIADLIGNQIPKEKLDGKIILIGATVSDLHDTVLTPKGIISGVEYNANVLDNLLLQRPIKLIPKIFEFLIGILIIINYILLSFRAKREISRLITWTLVAIILILPLISLILWQFGLALFFLSNILVTLFLLLTHGLYNWYRSEVEKRKIRQTFQHYFSPQVMEEILKNPDSLKLGGQKKEVTILFSDIRNFTTITESLPPEKLTKLLHEYFTEMSKEILATDGVLDKFIGDAIMAFWGAPVDQPDHADRAVTSAVAMIKKLKSLQKKWRRAGFPEINAGIGINSGIVTVGNMGSIDRFDYTVIGDDVNAASRLESLNKEYKTNIIISENTKNKLTKKVKTKSLGQVLVKGKTKPIKIFSINVK